MGALGEGYHLKILDGNPKATQYNGEDSECDWKKYNYQCRDCQLEKCVHDKVMPRVRLVLTNTY